MNSTDSVPAAAAAGAPAAAGTTTGEPLQVTLAVDRAVAAAFAASDGLAGFLGFLEECAAWSRGGQPFGLHTIGRAWLADPSVQEVTAQGSHGDVRVRLV